MKKVALKKEDRATTFFRIDLDAKLFTRSQKLITLRKYFLLSY